MKKRENKSPLLCDVHGCTNIARYSISIEFRPMKDVMPAKSLPILKVCEEHKENTLDDVFPTWESWNKVELNFIAKGFLPPKKKYSNIVLNEL